MVQVRRMGWAQDGSPRGGGARALWSHCRRTSLTQGVCEAGVPISGPECWVVKEMLAETKTS